MKRIIAIIVLSFVLMQCKSDKKYIIAKGDLAGITKNTTVAELDLLFKNDSIIKLPENGNVIYKYQIFKKGGNPLLMINMNVKRDSVKGIENIKIFDTKYKTTKGISTLSPFKDVMNNYSINKVETTLQSATIFINEINAEIALDKKDLNIQEFDTREISKDQIPDMAKIQYIKLWFY